MRIRGASTPGAPPGLREALFDRFDREGVPLKTSEGRVVVRLVLDGERLVAKRYAVRGIRRIGTWLRGNPARREHEAAARLSRDGIPVVGTLGWVARSRGWLGEEGIVALEDLGDVPTLEEVIATAGALARRKALEESGRIAGALHVAGYSHGDLHAGNFLRRTDGAFVLFDLQRARRARSAQARSRDLAFLLHSMRRAGESERARALRAYAQAVGRPFAEVAREILPVLAERALRRARGAARNALEPLYGRAPYTAGDWKGLAYPDRAKALPSALRSRPSEVGWRSEPGASGTLWIRAYPGDRARDAWKRLHAITALDLSGATPVAWLRTRDRSLLAVETPPGWAPLQESLARCGGRARGAMARALGVLLRRLHLAGARARSASPAGIFAGTEPPWVLLGDPSEVRLLVPPGNAERAEDALSLARAFSPPLHRGDLRRARRAFDPFGALSLP